MADSEGHIGMQGCGSFPQRKSQTGGLAPLAAWDPETTGKAGCHVINYRAFTIHQRDFVATANEEQNQPGQPMLVTQPCHDYRVRRIRERLNELPVVTIEDMQALQYDVVSLQARELLEMALPHLPDGNL